LEAAQHPTSVDYLADFPIPATVLPARLRALLASVGVNGSEVVEVATLYDDEDRSEHVHMLMAVVPESERNKLGSIHESADGVVSFSVPVLRDKGNSKEFAPSVSGYDYVVASWGDGSFYTYNLAEKVWMALGLTPRCLGNDEQCLVYDHLGLPEFGVAKGEVSAEFHWAASRNVSWRMSNEYLRKYLWMRGAIGVRAFFYEILLPESADLRALMKGETHVELKGANDWYVLDIREHDGGLLVQVWATVEALSCELCPKPTANGLSWNGIDGPMTRERANTILHGGEVYLDDRFLERYEQSAFYDSTPTYIYGRWQCSPSYRGTWSFTDCVRIGRNLVRVPVRELYRPKPDREIVHAHSFTVAPPQGVEQEEHIVAKTQRLIDQLLELGDNLTELGGTVGLDKAAADIVGISRAELEANGWSSYRQLSRLAQVAPLSMTQQAFLSRCKSLHEVWQRVPDGFLKSLLETAGCPRTKTKSLGSLKLLQALLNIVERLDAQEDACDAYGSAEEPEGWEARNQRMAALFLNNDLRIADAHDAVGQCINTLQDMGFDTAGLHDGYGRALDFVFDGVIEAFSAINRPIRRILSRHQ
jgi:hypothetical protein